MSKWNKSGCKGVLPSQPEKLCRRLRAGGVRAERAKDFLRVLASAPRDSHAAGGIKERSREESTPQEHRQDRAETEDSRHRPCNDTRAGRYQMSIGFSIRKR